jgi:hypothetical protein
MSRFAIAPLKYAASLVHCGLDLVIYTSSFAGKEAALGMWVARSSYTAVRVKETQLRI